MVFFCVQWSIAFTDCFYLFFVFSWNDWSKWIYHEYAGIASLPLTTLQLMELCKTKSVSFWCFLEHFRIHNLLNSQAPHLMFKAYSLNTWDASSEHLKWGFCKENVPHPQTPSLFFISFAPSGSLPSHLHIINPKQI